MDFNPGLTESPGLFAQKSPDRGDLGRNRCVAICKMPDGCFDEGFERTDDVQIEPHLVIFVHPDDKSMLKHEYMGCVEQFEHGVMGRRKLLFEHEAEGACWITRLMTHWDIGDLMVYRTRQYPRNVNRGLT